MANRMETTWVHRSVMVTEVLSYMAPRPGGIYCDATVGAGGHSEQLLLASAPDGRVYGLDRDASALEMASARLLRFGDRFVPLHGSFAELPDLLAQHGVFGLDGLLADLGVSSMQLDTPARGFSFQTAGPIDMRMDTTRAETALSLIGRASEETLASILWEYGEERHSRRIARALKQAHAAAQLTDTLALAQTVARSVPAREPGKHPATRTFQALRIAVNDELRQVHQLLTAAPGCLRTGGRLVVISFHSLEDRLVKLHLRSAPDQPVRPDAPAAPSPFTLLSRKPVLPTAEEILDNPRARSARLRAATRRDGDLAHLAPPAPTSEAAAWRR